MLLYIRQRYNINLSDTRKELMVMKKKCKPYIIILFSVIITLIMSANIIVNAEYDEYGNYYEPGTDYYSEEQSVESTDTSELTSADWSELQESLNSKFQTSLNTASNGNEDFKNIKEDSNPADDVNDTWWYLLTGLILITIGVIIIVGIIASSIHSYHNRKIVSSDKNNSKNKKN